jgi:hypothetical protein
MKNLNIQPIKMKKKVDKKSRTKYN